MQTSTAPGRPPAASGRLKIATSHFWPSRGVLRARESSSQEVFFCLHEVKNKHFRVWAVLPPAQSTLAVLHYFPPPHLPLITCPHYQLTDPAKPWHLQQCTCTAGSRIVLAGRTCSCCLPLSSATRLASHQPRIGLFISAAPLCSPSLSMFKKSHSFPKGLASTKSLRVQISRCSQNKHCYHFGIGNCAQDVALFGFWFAFRCDPVKGLKKSAQSKDVGSFSKSCEASFFPIRTHSYFKK